MVKNFGSAILSGFARRVAASKPQDAWKGMHCAVIYSRLSLPHATRAGDDSGDGNIVLLILLAIPLRFCRISIIVARSSALNCLYSFSVGY